MASGSCELCGLPLPNPPINHEIGGQTKHFCCEGCARVYEVAYDNNLLAQVTPQPQKDKSASLKDLLPQKGESAFFNIEGMWCAGCSLSAERLLRRQPGVQEADVSFAAERGRITYDPLTVNPEALLSTLSGLGYRAHLLSSKSQQEKERLEERISIQLITAVAFGMQVMMLYLVQLYPLYALKQFQETTVLRIQYAVWALATPVLFFGGLTFLRGAWRALRAKTANMDTLVALGVLSAYGYSVYMTLTGSGETYFDSVVMITTFILFGRYLETVGGAQARKDLRNLLHLQPEFAWKKEGKEWQKVRAEELGEGDTLLVKPGERVPADARIIEGDATFDESMLTGESQPVIKQQGDAIYAGTVAIEGAVICQVIHPPDSTRLSQIAALVSKTLSQKPRIQRLADQASNYFAFGILFLAAVTLVLWYLRTHSAGISLMAAVAVLVVACPCALGLATPLALTVTMGHAARRGILIRSPEAMETSASIRRIVFDKTGTLTLGELSVVDVVPHPGTGYDRTRILQLAASVEQYSEHPLGKAIVQANQNSLLTSSDFVSLRGAGASAQIKNGNSLERVSVGSARLIDLSSMQELAAAANQRAAHGETVVWVARNADPIGFIALRDQPNPTTYIALRMLKDIRISTMMLSGDTPKAAQAVAQALGIEQFEGSCSPEEKAEKITSYQKDGDGVGMVGDGVNDAPALAQANLSITVAGGTDIAGEASDLVLTRSDLTLIPWFIQLSRHTRRTILQNLGWAFAYNIVSVPLAMVGLISPVIASVAMATSSLLVVINSLRLRRL